MKQALGAGALVTLALGVTACGSGANTAATYHPAASPSPTPSTAKDALTASIDQLGSASYNVTANAGGVTGAGAVDATAEEAYLNLVTPIGSGRKLKMNTVATGGKVYLLMDAGIANKPMHLNPKTWLLIDPAKLGKDVALPLDTADLADPLDLYGLNQGVVSVYRTDATHLAGLIDLTRTGGVSSPDSTEIAKAGAAAKAVPFTATLDDQGRLIAFTVNGAKISKALQFTIVLSHYGAASAVSAPATSSVTNASSSIYSLLNG
jgi:hypothetical protein